MKEIINNTEENMGKVLEKKVIVPKPLMPFVTLDEALAFNAERPETWTRSPFVNAVLEAMKTVRPTTARNIAKYLDLEERDILSGMRIATGYTYLQFRYHLILMELERLRPDHKHLINDRIAQHLGFVNRKALSAFLNNEKTQRVLKDEGPSRHAKRCPGRTRLGI